MRLVLPCLLLAVAPASAADPSPADVFRTRLLPIFKSPNPSSCVQCHLAGVDLKDYILPDHDKTFRSLRDQGLIDLDAPEKSKILTLIAMGDGDPKTPRVQAANRRAEYEAFAAWIKASAADPALRSAPPLDPKDRAAPGKPVEVIRHARADRLLDSFERNVWAWRFRCMNCHTEGTPQCDKYVKEFGERVAWVKKAGPAATMGYLISSKLIDPQAPDKSPLLRKPLGEDEHRGGVKFSVGDQGYKGFRAWIEDVAAVRTGKYAAASDLPRDAGPARFGTEVWLKLTDVPLAWGGKLVRVDVYAWDAAKGAWEPTPLATSDRVVWGKGKLWQHTLTLLAAPGSDRAKVWSADKPAMSPGKYLARVYVDAAGRLANDWTAELGEKDYAGQVEYQAEWREGSQAMTVVNASAVRR